MTGTEPGRAGGAGPAPAAGRSAFRRPAGVAGGVDPATRPAPGAGEPGADPLGGLVPAGPDAATASAFGGPGGLQPPPAEGGFFGEPNAATRAALAGDPEAAERLRAAARPPGPEPGYAPFARAETPMVAADPAVAPPPAPAPEPPPPRVGAREALLGAAVPWRVLAAAAAAVLAVAAVGGYVGGRAGGWDRSEGERVRLVRETGRGPRTPIGEVAARVQPAVAAIRVGDPERPGVGETGSGVVIDDSGHILTNNHVIAGAAADPALRVQVQFQAAGDARLVDARIVGRDPWSDLAVLKVDDVAGLTVAALGDSDAVQVGDTVLAMGSPQGLNRTVTSGIVSAVHRPVRLSGERNDTDGVADAIQTDASINPGNSGGPLVDARGAVIGINTLIFSTSGGSQGIGFAIPINHAAGIAEQLIAGEAPRHPGIAVTAVSVGNGIVVGARLATVVPGGPADRAGLREGDVITAVGDREVADSDELMVALWSAGAGRPTTVTLLRDGAKLTVAVTPEPE